MAESLVSSFTYLLKLNRELQEEETSAPSSEEEEPAPVSPKDSQVLGISLAIYGSIFVVLWFLFCWLRLKYVKIYSIRGYVKDIKCKLATNQFGFFSWIWEVYDVNEKQIMDQCGFDSLCLVRILKWAVKVAVVGAVNALWLIPVYGSSEVSEQTAHISDYIASITVSNVPPQSGRLVATMLASYIFFGGTLYLLYLELDEWYPAMRFRFLAQPRARNYSVYVHGIPEEYKADYEVADYFQESFGLGRVQEAHVKLKTPELVKLTAQRAGIITKLEHAINVSEVQGIRPMHKVNKIEVDSIETYVYELKAKNLEITQRIEFLEMGGYDSDDPDAQMKLPSPEEGAPMDGGFITFYNLSSAQAAKQMNHARRPFEMQVLEAPDPSGKFTDVCWTRTS